jgi:hypothetical protein
MMKRTGLLSVIAVAILAACAKSPPPASVEDAAKAKAAVAAADNEEAPPAPAPEAQAAPPAMDRSEKAAGLLTLIDTAPQCQSFRAQLEEAAKVPADSPQAVDMNQIVASAHAAGCGKKP